MPNRTAFSQINGTAAHFANVATAEDQCVDGKCSKTHPHSDVSPIWMRPGQVHYDAAAEASATRYHDCAVAFVASGFSSAPPGCDIQPLGEPWQAPTKAKDLTPVYYLLFDKPQDQGAAAEQYLLDGSE